MKKQASKVTAVNKYSNALDAKAASENCFVWTTAQNEEISHAVDTLFDVDATLSALAAALDTQSDARWSRSRAVQALANVVNDAAYALSEPWSKESGAWTDGPLVTMAEHVEKLHDVVALLGALEIALDCEKMRDTDRDPSRVSTAAMHTLDATVSKLDPLRDAYRDHVRRFPKVHEPFAREGLEAEAVH